MASSQSRHRRRRSMDEPPITLSDVIHLKEEFIGLYEKDHLELQECINRLSGLMKTFEEDFRFATEASRYGGIVGIGGWVTMIGGLALAPFTTGASAVVGGAGALVALGGGIGSEISNFIKMNQQKEICENIINGFEEFQNKFIPMTDILKRICQYTNEILSHLNNTESEISAFHKCVASTRELGCTDDFGKASALLLKSIGNVEGIFYGLKQSMNSVINDTKEIADMDNLAKNGQISEREIKSRAGKFIVEMRKVIQKLQNIMDELTKTKDIIEKGLKSERAFLPRMLKFCVCISCVVLFGYYILSVPRA